MKLGTTMATTSGPCTSAAANAGEILAGLVLSIVGLLPVPDFVRFRSVLGTISCQPSHGSPFPLDGMSSLSSTPRNRPGHCRRLPQSPHQSSSQPPSLLKNHSVLSIVSFLWLFMITNPGDDSWASLHTLEDEEGAIGDIVHHDEKVFVLTNKSEFLAFDLTGPLPAASALMKDCPLCGGDGCYNASTSCWVLPSCESHLVSSLATGDHHAAKQPNPLRRELQM